MNKKIINKNIELTQKQKEFLVGHILGDGYCETQTKGIKKTWCTKIEQQAAHWEYVFYKYQILENLCTTGPKLRVRFDKRTQKTYYAYRFSTLRLECLKYHSELFYNRYDIKTRKPIKGVPSNINEYLTAHALAIWYMDDGHLHKRDHSVRLSTDGFQKYEVEYLRLALKTNFNIETTIRKNTKGFLIYVRAESTKIFMEIVKPFIIDIKCMNYKLLE